MRRLPLLAVVLILFATANTASGQNNFWTFPEQFWIPGTFAPLNLPTSGYSGAPSDFAHAGIMDPYGEIDIFVVDGAVYDKNGNTVDVLQPSSGTANGYSEVLIVNEPGSCTRYYIFFVGQGSSTLGGDYVPMYAIYDRDIGGLEYFSDDVNVEKIEDNLIESWTDAGAAGAQSVKGVHIAATKERADGESWIFISTNDKVYRIELDCDGLHGSGWQYDYYNEINIQPWGYRSELEIYEDTASSSIKVAVPFEDPSTSVDRIKVAIFEIDSTSATVSNEKIVSLGPPVSSGDRPFVHGLEFSADGTLLYILHEPSNSLPGPLSKYDLDTEIISNSTFAGMSSFDKSQLQVTGDSADYTLWLASPGYLGSLYDPDDPQPGAWNSTAVPLNNYNLSTGGLPLSSIANQKYLIPDQVDYEDYEKRYWQDCECCNKYAYGGQTKDTLHQAFGTENWAYGVGSNPWNAEEGDTIFIRDELVIKAGANVTISDMWFKFGPDARVIVERGTQTENGGRLTLQDSTVFTADFRCSKREYGCEEPDSCKTKLWKGVRVEGYANEGQTYGFQTNQAFFGMKTEAMIEYAEVAIRAGHESENNYGGGVIFLTDARLKDNPIGVRFDPYQRMPSPPDEEMTLSKIKTSKLFWSIDNDIEDFTSNRHVDVRESSGIRLEANRYANDNWEAYDGPDRGTGIYSINSRVVDTWLCTSAAYPCPETDVERSSFLNMHKGFDAYASGSTRTIESLHAVYDNNTIGLLSNGLGNPLILDNDFYVPTRDNHTGIYLLGSTGYAVENNYFTSGLGPGPNWNIGIAVVSSGQANNEIYRNLFEDITLGIITQEQNGYCRNLDFGLKWKCNQFEQPIRYADIYVQSGNVSDDQGLCTSGSPAGNKFSHSHDVINGHYDLKVKNANQPYNDPACSPTLVPLEIVYKHHSPLNTSFLERLAPEEYTNSMINPLDNDHVGLIACGVAYDFKNSCAVKNTSVHEPEDFPTKSDDEEVTMESLETEAAEIHDALDANAEILDNGNTELLISMIYNGAPAEEIEALLEEAGEMVSLKVLQDLINSNDESLQTLGENVVWELSETDVDLENIESISLPSQEVEAEWMQLNDQAHHFWNQVVKHFNRDSLAEFPGTAIHALINTYQPASQQRFVAALSTELGMEVPAWIEVENNPLAAPTASMPTAGENGTLPRNVGSYIDEGVFNEYRNVAAFNQNYIEQGAEYDPGYIDLISEGYELPDGDKSNTFDSDDFQQTEKSFLLLPNPFNERITLRAEEDLEYEKLRVTIRDVVGRVVYDANYGANQQVVIDGNRFSTGVFIYTIFTDGQMAQSGKIVKAK